MQFYHRFGNGIILCCAGMMLQQKNEEDQQDAVPPGSGSPGATDEVAGAGGPEGRGALEVPTPDGRMPGAVVPITGLLGLTAPVKAVSARLASPAWPLHAEQVAIARSVSTSPSWRTSRNRCHAARDAVGTCGRIASTWGTARV